MSISRPYYIQVKHSLERVNRAGILHGGDITEDFMEELLHAQKFQCALTGVKIHLARYTPNGTRLLRPNENILHTASIDRIDSDVGYYKDNVRWLSYIANIGRQRESEEHFAEAIAAIKAATKPEPVNIVPKNYKRPKQLVVIPTRDLLQRVFS